MMKRSLVMLAATLICGLSVALCAVEGKQVRRADFLAPAVVQNSGDIPDDVREKIRLLESADSSERAGAACALGQMGQRAVAAIPALIKILGDDTPTQRVYCGEGSSFRGNSQESEKSSPGEHAAGALAVIGEPSVAPLIAASKSDDWRVRANATWALGVIKDSRTVEAVLAAVRDGDWRVRAKAAWGLGLKSDARVAEALVGALRDGAWQVRRQAAWASGLQGDERSVEPLVAALRDEQADVRHQAAWALGLKGDSRAVEPLHNSLRDQDWQVRSQAAWALGLKGNPSSVEPLIAALKDENAGVRQQAAWALGLRGDRRASAALNAALQDSAAPVRKNAAWALRLIRLKSGDLRPDEFGRMEASDAAEEDTYVEGSAVRLKRH
ncbi:MAG TPA: HEAT repeat domain-containing protein [Pyrinomonadaceae bacterium]